MKHLFYYHFRLLSILLAIFACIACGDDDDEANTTPAVQVTLRSQSISEGAEVEANATTELKLTYSVSIKVANAAAITLNGAVVAAQRNPQDVMGVIVPLTLKEGTTYTLTIPEGCIVANGDATASAPAFTLHFTTKAKPQPATGNIPAEPVTAATDEAKKLYTFFLNNYGKKVVSSVMANVNWNNECAEKVFKLTGKYPAMNCYDFIHICFSPANWIDYTKITPVQQWVNDGGLVQLMWHFNVPKSEGSTDVTCTPSETSFKAANALIDGTWENKWFYGQMDKVVATLLKLQEAGIAATWRPFHEAAGNATARQQASWTKAWFWWGYDGAQTYKKLWVAMYDYFQQKGVKNLIWIWTTQNYNGNSQQYNQDTDWYPGDQYVDIVARDLYGVNAAKNAQEYAEIQAQYPNKMGALGECGRGDGGEAGLIGDCFSQGALWSHFMVWYQGGQGSTDTMCSDAWWRDAMSNEYVITRDEVAF